MPELTVGEWIGFVAMLSLVVVAVIAVGALVDSFQEELERGSYSSNLPEVDETRVPPMPMCRPPREDYDHRLYDLAISRGWALPPVNNVHGAAAWNHYWFDMERYEKGALSGRPVAPHRSA